MINDNNPEQGRWYLTKDILIPVIIAIVSALGGGYIKKQFDLSTALEKTNVKTQTLLGLALDIEKLASKNQDSGDILKKVKELAIQARAVEVAASQLRNPHALVKQDVDFWLRKNTTAILGGGISFGVNDDYFGVPQITVYGKRHNFQAGERIDFKTTDGESCFVSFIVKPTNELLYGFKIVCPSQE